MTPLEFPPTQGAEEAWTDTVFRPFWLGLDANARSQYLHHWEASPEWRDALAFAFEGPLTMDHAADAAESDSHLDEWRQLRWCKRGFLSRLLGGRD